MSATYNWTYRDGVPNKYGIVIPSAADNVAPSGVVYVALFGNDATGNGSRQLPYRTLVKAFSIYGNNQIVVGSGVYREATIPQSNGYVSIVGDGDVTFDATYNGGAILGGQGTTNNVCNIRFTGNGLQYAIPNGSNVLKLYDCIFDGCAIQMVGSQNYSGPIKNCTFINVAQAIYFGGSMINCTFYNCNNIDYNFAGNNIRSCIFHTCNIAVIVSQLADFGWNLFFQCNFKLSSNGGYGGGSVYPAIPSGYAYYSTISELTAAYVSSGGLGTPLTNQAITDPLFNDITIGDFSLQQTSPAKNMSYYGTYIGAIGIGMSILARETESEGSFDFSTNVNLTVMDDSITFTDDTMDAQIDTKPQFNSLGRVINAIPLYGFNADRNGQYVDTIPDLGAVLDAGDTMQQPASYLVVGGAITYNGSTYQPGDRLTTVSGTTTFITGVGGQVQEITEAPERHTVMARFQDGGVGPVTTASELTVGWWYFVEVGNADYGGTNYGDGQASRYFKCVSGTTGFTDASSSGVTLSVETAMPDEATLAFQHYDPAFQPTSNNTGDVRTGAVLRGNGDPDYVRGTGHEWTINSKHMQFRYMFKHSNLTP